MIACVTCKLTIASSKYFPLKDIVGVDFVATTQTRKKDGESHFCDTEMRHLTGNGFHWMSVSALIWWNWCAFRFDPEQDLVDQVEDLSD